MLLVHFGGAEGEAEGGVAARAAGAEGTCWSDGKTEVEKGADGEKSGSRRWYPGSSLFAGRLTFEATSRSTSSSSVTARASALAAPSLAKASVGADADLLWEQEILGKRREGQE